MKKHAFNYTFLKLPYRILSITFLLYLAIGCKTDIQTPISEETIGTTRPKEEDFIAATRHTSPLEYKEIDNSDGFWKRQSYYESKIEGEKYYQVRVQVVDSITRFYFLGIQVFEDKNDRVIKAFLYELDENKNIYIIDSLPVLKETSLYHYENEFISRQYDNLFLLGDTLYYYKEVHDNDYSNKTTQRPQRNYYAYTIDSKNKSVKINENKIPAIQNRTTLNSSKSSVITPTNTKMALTNTNDIYVCTMDSWKILRDSFYTHNDSRLLKSMKDLIDFNVADFPPFKVKEPSNPCNTVFGGMTWDTKGESLYFDNSGPCFACIWKVNTNTRELSKIVPEHEAIHPYYFKMKNKEYIAYVFENHIQLAQPPEIKQTPIPKDIAVYDPKQYYLNYDQDKPFNSVGIFSRESGEQLILEKGNYFLGSENSGVEFYFFVDDNKQITGTYSFFENEEIPHDDDTDYENMRNTVLRFGIEKSKINSRFTSNNNYEYYYQYNQHTKEAYGQEFTKQKRLIREYFYAMDNQNNHLITKKVKEFNITGDDHPVTYDSHVIEKYDSLNVLFSREYVNEGITDILDNKGVLIQKILNGKRYKLKEPAPPTFKWEVFENIGNNDVDSKPIRLNKNLKYLIQVSDTTCYKFSTNKNNLIKNKILLLNEHDTISVIVVENSKPISLKNFKNKQLVLEGYYNAADSSYFITEYIDNDSINKIETIWRLKNNKNTITAYLKKGGRYVIDNIENKYKKYNINNMLSFSIGINGDKTKEIYNDQGKLSKSTYLKDNILYTDEYDEGKIKKRSYKTSEGSITEIYRKGKLYRKEIAYLNDKVLYLKVYDGKDKLKANVEMPMVNDLPAPELIKL